MSEVFIATVGGLAALGLWGTSDWLTSKSSKKLAGNQVNLAMQLSGAVVMAIIWLLSGEGLPNASQFLVLLTAGSLFTLAYLAFIRALSIGEAGIVVPLSNTYPLVTLLLTAIWLTVAFSSSQIVAMLTIVVGAVLLGSERLNWRRVHRNLSKEVPYALATAILWGVGFFAVNTVVDKLAWEPILATISIAMGVYALVIAAAKNRQNTLKIIKRLPENKLGILAGLTLTLGSIAFYIAAEMSGSVLIPAVIAAGSPLFTSLLAAVFEKEKIIFVKRLGATLVVAGVVLLNIS